MDNRTAEIIDQIQACRRDITSIKHTEKSQLDKIDEFEAALKLTRAQLDSSEALLNKLELNLRSALAGTPSTVEVPPPIMDPILDQVGREG